MIKKQRLEKQRLEEQRLEKQRLEKQRLEKQGLEKQGVDPGCPTALLRKIVGRIAPRPPMIAVATLLLTMFVAVPVARAEIDSVAVQRSIDRGLAYLKKTQLVRGGWTEYSGNSCGLSSLCTLAMLTSGVPGDDTSITRAMAYLRTHEPNDTYSVSLQTLVYCQLGSARDLAAIRRNVDWLVEKQQRRGDDNQLGAWGYGDRGSGDPSNTQFAILALGAAEERGIEVPAKTLELSLEYWKKRQRPDGSWTYNSLSGTPTGSMVAAGIASIIIARGGLGSHSANLTGQSLPCCGDEAATTDPAARALNWLASAFTLRANPGGTDTYFYYLYALERVGRLSGRRFIGDHDWYREGAEVIVSLQDEFQGFWAGTGIAENNRDISTSFALLFLSKGKRQVVVGKLDYSAGQSSAWNRHPDALRQLVRHVERDWGRDLTWQTIDAEQSAVTDLLQTPVLVIGGSDALNFPEALSSRLASYIDQGGSIVFDNDGSDGCGNDAAFRASVERLCREWFPDAKLEPLPPDHPVWFAQHRVDPPANGTKHWIEGVQACCRTPVFYAPKSLSCRWSYGDRLFRRSDESPGVRAEIESGIRLGENIIAYATGRELKDKLQSRTVINASESSGGQRGVLRLATLATDTGGDQAKRALPNVATLLRQRVPMQVSAAPESILLDENSLRDVGVLWIHGRESFEFTDKQRQALQQYIERDGYILANSICASDAFAESFRREMKRLLPDSPLESMPPNHRAWTTAFGGFDVSRVTIRSPQLNEGQALRKQSESPRLEVAVVNEFASVFFSPLDLSCALESQNSIQCEGYSTDETVKIVANVLLYALQQ